MSESVQAKKNRAFGIQKRRFRAALRRVQIQTGRSVLIEPVLLHHQDKERCSICDKMPGAWFLPDLIEDWSNESSIDLLCDACLAFFGLKW